jgi:prolyl 4-hydroxylase
MRDAPDPNEALDMLRRQADAGEAGAMTRLGAALLAGREAPYEPEEGAALVKRAVERGDPQAMSILATLTAAGVGAPQDWDTALDLLARAAGGGAPDAREQLLLLSGDRELADEARRGWITQGMWRRLREAIDLEKCVVPKPPRQVFDWPRIWLAENFATPQLCAWLVKRAMGNFTPSMMFTGQKAVFHATRTCSDFSFSLVEGGCVMLILRTRISLLTGLRTEQMEPPQIFHYATGQGIDPHYDSVYDGEHGYGRHGDYHGDRLATLLMYLNDDYDGGVLQFVRVGYSYRGRAGDAIFFASLREGKRDERAEHGATTVTRGEKFILSQWIHDRPFAA